ncbi:molybdopterin-binding protein [Streptomyces sp. NPDC015130]|uniref:molybdopterin-binding protein n=1 Tax=Streptomyces sp. NPDC015130 TaxID=3364940 RepID=UPI0036FCC774
MYQMRQWIAAAEAELEREPDREAAPGRPLRPTPARPASPPVPGPAAHPLPWERARALAWDAGRPLPVVTRALDEALGHALAGPLTVGDAAAPDVLLPAGTTVTPAVVGLAAAAGHDRPAVHRRPRVELLDLGGAPAASGPLLASWLARHGAEVTGRRPVPGDPGSLREAVHGCTADVVVTLGDTGTGTGPGAGAGARLLVDTVAVRPGLRMLLAELPPAPDGGPRFLVGLPGEPSAALAGAVTLAVPLLRRLGGHADPAPGSYRTTAATALPGHPHDTRLLPVRRGAHGVAPVRYDEAESTPAAGFLSGLVRAHGLAVVPPGGVPAGAEVEVLALPGA